MRLASPCFEPTLGDWAFAAQPEGILNHILSALSREDHALLLPRLERCLLKKHDELERPTRRIEHVYFIEAGIAAVISISGSTRIGLGLIGCEGASGISVILGDDRSPHSTMMLSDGSGLRLHASDVATVMADQPELRRLFLRYTLGFFNQAAHTALSNASSVIQQRIARWILMAYDRVAQAEIPLTHETIAGMLGVRRAGVTEALHELGLSKLISLRRGYVVVLDRAGLEKLAGHFYGIPEKEFARLVGTYWPPVAAPPAASPRHWASRE